MIDKFSRGFINTVYDFNDFTINELLCKLAQKMDEVITQSNESFNYLDWLKGEGLSDEVIKIMLEWKEDGTLETLINELLFNGLNTKIDEINSQLNTIVQLNGEIYTLSETLNISSNLRGINGKTILTSSDRLNSDILKDNAITISSNKSYLVVENITIEGGVSNEGIYPRSRTSRIISKNTFRRGIYCDGKNSNIKNITIRNCVFKNLEDFPILLDSVENVTIENCHFYNCIDVGLIHCKNITFEENKIEKSADNGVSISRGCKKAIVNNNIIKECAYAGIWLSGWSNENSGELGLGVNEFTCLGNVITNCGHFGIQLTDAPKNGVISNNTIKNITRGTYDEPNDFRGVGIKISSYPEVKYTIAEISQMAENLFVTDNNIIECARGGIEVRGLDTGNISDNLIKNCGSEYLADGFTVIPSSSIEQNFGLRFYIKNTLVDIKNNKIIDKRTTPFCINPIIFINDSSNENTHCIIKDNMSYGCINKLTNLLRQDSNNTNILENLVYSIQNSNYNSYIATDTDGYKRMGIGKISGQIPSIIVGNATPFKILKANTVNIDDVGATYSEIGYIDGNGNIFVNGSINMKADGSWGSGKHIILGNYHLWIDTQNRLRIKNGAPNTETDGTVVGSQS